MKIKRFVVVTTLVDKVLKTVIPHELVGTTKKSPETRLVWNGWLRLTFVAGGLPSGVPTNGAIFVVRI